MADSNKKLSRIPLPSLAPAKSQVTTPNPEPSEKWRFSLSYWSQPEKFGLQCEIVSLGWFVALLEKLKALSHHTIEDIQKGGALAENLRFHKVPWGDRNLSVKREEFDVLIPKQYRSNDEDYEVLQFQLSKGTGRVFGFFDEHRVFQIVLLDPMHNFHLTAANPKVRPTKPQPTPVEETELKILALREVMSASCNPTVCKVVGGLEELMADASGKNFVCLDNFGGEVATLLALGKYSSANDMLLDALIGLYEKHGLSN